MFSKNIIGQQITELVNDVLDDRWHSKIQSVNVESLGVKDGKEIINDFLDNHEYGCSFEHLEYMIFELNLPVTSDQKRRLRNLKKLFSQDI